LLVEKVADAVVYAVSYINCRDEDGDETYLRDDVKSLEYLAHILQQASHAEQDALAATAKGALAAELAAGATPDSKWVQDYSTWMEDMFGEEWSGNDRAEPVHGPESQWYVPSTGEDSSPS
jgi:hypothetical protein